MTMLISFLAEADEAALGLERARRELEAAKQNLESAKQAFDAVIAKAEEMGLARSKLKRLTEERITALIETGLAELPALNASPGRAVETKAERPKRQRKTAVPEAKSSGEDEAFDPKDLFPSVTQ